LSLIFVYKDLIYLY